LDDLVLSPTETADQTAWRLQQALEFSGVGDWSWNPSTDEVRISPAAQRIFGLVTPLGLTWSAMQAELLHPEDAGKAAAAVAKAISEKAQYRIEYRIRRPSDGKEAWVLASGRATYDAAGQPLAMWGLVQDITEQKLLEGRLRDSEAEARRVADLLEAIGASSPDLIYAKDRDCRTIYANAATLNALGVPTHQVLGRTAAEYASNPSEGEDHALNDRAVMETGVVQVMEEIFTSPSGETRTYRSTKAPLRQRDGEIIGIVGVSVDVSDQKATEARIRRQSEQLEKLAQATLLVAQAENLDATLQQITRAAREIIGAHQAVVSLTRGPDWSQAINTLELSEAYAAWRDYATPPDGSGIYAWVCEQNRPVRMSQSELEAHPRWRGFGRHRAEHPPIRGWLAAPLVGRDGRNLGLIQLSDKIDGSEFDDSDLAMLVQLAAFGAAAVEQSLVEGALRASEERLKLAQRAARAVTWVHDVASGVTRWSDVEALSEITGGGFSSETTLRDWVAILHPDDRSSYFEQWKTQLDRGEGRVAFRVLRGGEVRWLEVFGRVTSREQDGSARLLVGITMDVTDRMQAQAALLQSEARLRLAVDAGRMAVWEHDPRADKLTSSPELNRLLGYPDDARPDLEELRARYYPGDRERVLAEVEAALARGERFIELEYRFYRLDGELRWFLNRVELLLDPDGTPSKAVGVLLDVTNRKTTEQALLEREQDLNAALQAGSLAILDYDHRTQRFAPSERLAELYGYPPDTALTLEHVRARYHPEDAASIFARAAAENADPNLNAFTWTLRLLLPGGQVRWVEGRGEYVRGEDGRIARSRGVVMDITERKRWEEHQRLLVNELNHRVKNTLAIVQGLAQQSFRNSADPAAARDAFEARLTALSAAHNLLTQENWEAASLADIVASSLCGSAAYRDTRYEFRGPEVRLSPQTAVSLALALHELCTNAIKYGALSNESGVINVEWEVAGSDPRRLRLQWRERGGPPVQPPATRGFGTRMIEKGLSTELRGKVHIDFQPAGVICTIDAPLPEPDKEGVGADEAVLP
jgi:PAS domain S-box-containing protein